MQRPTASLLSSPRAHLKGRLRRPEELHKRPPTRTAFPDTHPPFSETAKRCHCYAHRRWSEQRSAPEEEVVATEEEKEEVRAAVKVEMEATVVENRMRRRR